MLEAVIANGSALNLFGQLIEAQGGDARIVHDPSLLPAAKFQIEVPAQTSGTIAKMEAEDIGVAAMLFGAGRATKDDEIDLAVGIVLKKKIGDKVTAGEPLAIIHSNREDVAKSIELIQKHIHISDQAHEKPNLIHEMITG